MNPSIGLQLWSIRNSLQKDYVGTLETIAKTGYKNLELITNVQPDGLVFGESMRAPELRKHLDELGLRAVSSHFVPTADMDLEKIVGDCQVLGVTSLGCAIAFFTDPAQTAEFCRTFNHYAEVCKKGGVQLYYHNHFHEFQIFGEKSVYELLIEQLDRDLVMFEFDTYWAARGGQDPIYWLKKLGKRCDLLHQKDLPASVAQANLFHRFGYDSQITIDTFWGLQDPQEFIEVGEGVLPLAAIFEAFRKYNGARYVFIEQDMTRRTEAASIKVSLENLTRILG